MEKGEGGRCIFLAGRGWRWQEKREKGSMEGGRKPFELLSCLDGGGGYIIFLRGKLQCARVRFSCTKERGEKQKANQVSFLGFFDGRPLV